MSNHNVPVPELCTAAIAAVRCTLDGRILQEASTRPMIEGTYAEDAALMSLGVEVGHGQEACVEAVRASRARHVASVRALSAAVLSRRSASRASRSLRERRARARISQALGCAASLIVRCDSLLARQMEAAERRLAELAHECVGEREKWARKLESRARASANEIELAKIEAKRAAKWSLFVASLKGLPADDPAVHKFVRSTLTASEASMFLKVARFEGWRPRRKEPSKSFKAIVDALQQAEGASNRLKLSPALFVTTQPLTWLALGAPAHCFEMEGSSVNPLEDPCLFALASTRVYYDVDDRRANHGAERADVENEFQFAEARAIADSYATNKPAPGNISVSWEAKSDFAPAWVAWDKRTLAPATLLQLLETREFARLVDDNRIVHSGVVNALYAITTSTPVLGDAGCEALVVRKLTSAAVLLLIDAFVAAYASRAVVPPGLELVNPEPKSTFALVAAPGSSSKRQDTLLVAWAESGDVLSDHTWMTMTKPTQACCEWRACLSMPSSDIPSGRRAHKLCDWHAQLKHFLDSASRKATESARFLPTLPASKKKRRETRLRAESALLTELCDGKLETTVRTFCERAAAESSRAIEDGPRWARWRSPRELQAAANVVERAVEIAETVVALEQAATRELRGLKTSPERVKYALEAVHRHHLDLLNKRQRNDTTHRQRLLDERLELDFAKHKLDAFRSARTQPRDDSSDTIRTDRRRSDPPSPAQKTSALRHRAAGHKSPYHAASAVSAASRLVSPYAASPNAPLIRSRSSLRC